MRSSSNTPLNTKIKKQYALPLKTMPSVRSGANLNMNKYQQAYQDCGVAKDKIQTRLERLHYEMELLKGMKGQKSAYNGDLNALYNLKTLSNAKGKLANPNLYAHQHMEPIYYPLELPMNAEPVTLPKIEMGNPVSNKCKGGLGIEDLIALLAAMRRQPQVQMPPIIYPPPQPQPIYQPPPPKYVVEDEYIPKIPKSKKTTEGNRGLKRDWWRLARDFVNMNNFFSTANKYSKFAKVRDSLIKTKTFGDLEVLKNWMKDIQDTFWNEFKVFGDLNVSFKNIDSTIKIQRESQKIVAMLKIYLQNLIQCSTRLIDIPERVQKILYEYIKERAYYPTANKRSYLSTYQINRLDFNFYGGIKNPTKDQIGMMVAVLLISSVTVQLLLLRMKDNFVEFRNYPNMEISAKYLGSILHYLTRDTFQNSPTMIKELLALVNFYRNYHLYNEQVYKQDDFRGTNMVFMDTDEYSEYLIPENQITQFWNLNSGFVDQFKNYVYSWACKLGELIKLKYQKGDVNLLPKRNLKRPEDKTAEYEVIPGKRRQII